MRRGRPHPRSSRLAAPAAILVALVLAGPAAAGYRDHTPLPRDVAEPARAAASHSELGGGAVLRTLLGLLVVVGVVYGIYWLLKTYAKSKGARSDGQMDVVATTALGPNRALHLVRVGDELVLVGSAEQAVTGIRVYEADDAARLLPLLDRVAPPATASLPADPRGRASWSVLVDELRRRTART